MDYVTNHAPLGRSEYSKVCVDSVLRQIRRYYKIKTDLPYPLSYDI